jgi:hypothetical protein
LQALAEARAAAERFAHQPAEVALDPTMRAQLAERSSHLPELWGSGWLQPELGNYASLVERILALSQEGQPDQQIADRLTAEGVCSSRQQPISKELVGKIRRAQRRVGMRQQFRSEPQIAGEWTIHGLAQELGVRRTGLYTRIRNGTLPAHRHPGSGHYLIPNDPDVLALLQTERDTHLRA